MAGERKKKMRAQLEAEIDGKDLVAFCSDYEEVRVQKMSTEGKFLVFIAMELLVKSERLIEKPKLVVRSTDAA